VRPIVVRRFKERDDAVDNTKQSLKSGAQKIQDNLKRAAEPAGMDSQVKVNPAVPALTRRREVFVGRLAIFGIVAAGFWEWYLPSRPNILQQISGGLNLVGLDVGPGFALAIVLGLVGYSAIALAPGNPTYSEENQKDVAKRPPGPNQEAPQNLSIQEGLGISGWGFSKRNEVFVSRMAMLGFAAGVVGQMAMGGVEGPGVLAQIARYLNTPADDAFYSQVPTWFIGYTIFALGLAYFRGKTGEKTRNEEKDIY
jgi:hypothetical protein